MLDYLGIIRELTKHKIEFIVVGGVAVNLHGVPRMTYDLDLLVKMDDKPLRNLLGLLKQWGFRPSVPVNIMDFAVREKREDWIKNKNMKAFGLKNPDWALSEIDIIVGSPVSYESARPGIKRVKVGNVTVPLISLDALIKMKRNTGRAQDEADINHLKMIKNEKKKT